jgi:succinyl-CoA synthetase beta subunit
MNLHEYQAKQVLSSYKIPVPLGTVITTAAAVPAAIAKLNSTKWVVKAQVHAGGRGKAGGVRLVNSPQEVNDAVLALLGKNLVTYQTTTDGQPVQQILLEEPADIAKELYLSAVIDRVSQRLVIMASTEGGVEIEEVAHNAPEKIFTVVIEPFIGVQAYQARQLAFALGLSGKQIQQFSQIILAIGKMCEESDLSLLEINPLIITNAGDLLCLDAKITVDDNALYRQPLLASYRDPAQEDERENRAREWELNYIALDGDIACMVNGAGLAMATMDLIKLHGGNPANFLDVGGGATAERVTEAFKIILSDLNVKAILVNIFGGIVRCDLIADGIIAAVQEVGTKLPVVVRLEGNNAELGLQKLQTSNLNIIPALSFANAAEQVVKLAGNNL